MQQPLESAWNPGLQSDIPQNLLPLVTLFRKENAFISYKDAFELSDLTGLPVLELASLRPERLVTHSLLVRVTADLTVPDGPQYAQLGINLRAMVERIQTRHVRAKMPEIDRAIDEERNKATEIVAQRLDSAFRPALVDSGSKPSQPSFLQRWFGGSKSTSKPVKVAEINEISLVERWKQEAKSAETALEKACLQSLAKCVDTIISRRGRMLPDHELVTRLVVNQVINTYGSDIVDGIVGTLWDDAVVAEGYRCLPAQDKPVIMNVKGASASGKSTIRPQQRQLAHKLGIPWEDFALISPDYWRKYLLDYSTLGEHYKYGAMLTGRELEIVDKKLDRYMAKKAAKGTMSHLLIDRFRFDSFVINTDCSAGSKLLTRFGDRVFLFFMVTHPAETVTRAWERGKKTGRFKAVDDLLYHNVEAFTGMPALFLSWVTARDKKVHFEFLDNDVPEGDLPRTAAFGHNNQLVVLDINLLLNIDRYRKVNISAQRPDDIFQSSDLEPSLNTDFVTRCVKTVDTVLLADQDTMKEYAAVRSGKLVWWDYEYIQAHKDVEGLIAVLECLGYNAEAQRTDAQDGMQEASVSGGSFTGQDFAAEKRLMVGHWSAR